MDEAREKVRAKLGSDALIVKTRTYRRGGVFGVGGREVVEVYATDTRSRIENVKRERSSRSRSTGAAAAAEAEKPGGVVPAPITSGPEREAEGRESVESISSALGQIRKEIRDLAARSSGALRYDHPFLADCYDLLVSREVEARLADRIVQQIGLLRLPADVPDPARVRSVVRLQLARVFIPTPEFDERKRPRIIALVGPTGVGKTTTIAKLAARAKINERQRVGLITLDTFRIAAVDQLEKYAQIIGLPLQVATTPDELEAAVEGFRAAGVDLVFIDSAGRSPRDELKMVELREFLAVVPDVELHLVVSTTTHGKTIESTAGRFAALGFHMLILTKVDETVSFGSLVSALISIGRPVSFVTDGQNVPDDIMPADPERLADLVLKSHAL
jgi:flagellar biosynthesis protein FlhF